MVIFSAIINMEIKKIHSECSKVYIVELHPILKAASVSRAIVLLRKYLGIIY